jgi:hypothetical protein
MNLCASERSRKGRERSYEENVVEAHPSLNTLTEVCTGASDEDLRCSKAPRQKLYNRKSCTSRRTIHMWVPARFATRIRPVVGSHRSWSRFRRVIAPQIAIVGAVIVPDIPVVRPVVGLVAMFISRHTDAGQV